MSVELTGDLREQFETQTTRQGFELVGQGRMRRLAVEFGEGWGHPLPLEDSVGAALEHEAGVLARVVVRSGQRLRLEVTLESVVDETVTVPGPLLRFEGARPTIAWLAGATGEVVFPSSGGPGLLTQRRGIASQGSGRDTGYLMESEPLLRPRQTIAAAWTYETYPGDLLDLPPEATWLPWARYVVQGESVEISAPDGALEVPEALTMVETDGEFEITPEPGLHEIKVWSAGSHARRDWGISPLDELRAELVANQTGIWTPDMAYLAARHLTESWADDAVLDQLDRTLAALLEERRRGRPVRPRWLFSWGCHSNGRPTGPPQRCWRNPPRTT